MVGVVLAFVNIIGGNIELAVGSILAIQIPALIIFISAIIIGSVRKF
jgi:uncharacterized membrane protein (DUF106 family)